MRNCVTLLDTHGTLEHVTLFIIFHSIFLKPDNQLAKVDILITPCSTPNQKRKDNNRRRSNLFTPNKKEDKSNRLNDVGIGRSIPVKQGFLYKKTNSTINKDWKKKFVTLNDDGSLRYYPSMNVYIYIQKN